MSKVLRITSPVKWIGGKGQMVSKLLQRIPRHKVYVEVFGGGASLLLSKKPSPIEVYNDLDRGLISLFRVIRDKEKFKIFHDMVKHTPYSREEWKTAAKEWEEETDEIRLAYLWFLKCRLSYSGRDSFGFSVFTTSRGVSGATAQWIHTIETLPLIHARMMPVQIENTDFRKLLARYDSPDTFFYCDPPYISGTRVITDDYANEMTNEDHKELVDLLLASKSKILLSGYAHPIYEKLEENGWSRSDFETFCWSGRSSGNPNLPKRTETLWSNYLGVCVSNRGRAVQSSFFGRLRI